MKQIHFLALGAAFVLGSLFGSWSSEQTHKLFECHPPLEDGKPVTAIPEGCRV